MSNFNEKFIILVFQSGDQFQFASGVGSFLSDHFVHYNCLLPVKNFRYHNFSHITSMSREVSTLFSESTVSVHVLHVYVDEDRVVPHYWSSKEPKSEWKYSKLGTLSLSPNELVGEEKVHAVSFF